MIIKNGLVWEESGSFRKKELVVDTTTHRIAETAEDDTVFDAEGLYVIPGLVDVHIHGARGHDFSDGNSKGLAEIAQYLHSCGVTSFCPTSMTLPEEQLTAAFATINDVPDAAGYAHIAGIHMEGPYLSPEKKGAQKASYLHAPDAAMFRRLSAASGNKIRIITIAPELPGSDAFIREFKDTVAISLGHSTASYEIAENAFAAGANHVTHLFNAMPPLHHRDPGIIGAAADCPHAMAEIICDGIHVAPAAVRAPHPPVGHPQCLPHVWQRPHDFNQRCDACNRYGGRRVRTRRTAGNQKRPPCDLKRRNHRRFRHQFV